MNTRIRELADQAFDYCCETYRDSDGPVPWVWEEKFGELIIQECLRVLDEDDRRGAAVIIQQHFGVTK